MSAVAGAQLFLDSTLRELVEFPDHVQVERLNDDRGVLLRVTVHPDDLGKVIGKGGSTANALRTLLRALGLKDNAHYSLKIVDNGQEAA